MIRRRFTALAVVLAGVVLAGCQGGGNFCFLGYTTQPNYDTCIKTVYVPMFQSQIMLDETRRELPEDLTRAVVREIESKTPYKIVSDCAKADTELSGRIVSLTKNLLNRNQQNEIREAETVLTVGIVWKNLRTGEYLSKQRQAPGVLPTPGIPSLDIPDLAARGQTPLPPPPSAPVRGAPPPPPNPDAAPVLVTGLGDYIPELGQSTTTAYQQSINRLATQIVSIMEKPW
jgi:hypothetical protein